MKTITVNVPESVDDEFRTQTAKVDREAKALIREAMEEYRQRRMNRATSLRDRRPNSVGSSIALRSFLESLFVNGSSQNFLRQGA